MEKVILCEFLKNSINGNISWIHLVERYLTGAIDKKTFFLNIKRYAWINKRKNLPPQTYSTNKLIHEYTKIIMNGSLKNKSIGILYTDLNSYTRYIIIQYEKRLNILETILNMKRYKYTICNTVEEVNKFDVIIPLTSFAVKDIDKKIDKNKLLYYDHNNYSIIIANKLMFPIYIQMYTLIHEILMYVYATFLSTGGFLNFIFIETV